MSNIAPVSADVILEKIPKGIGSKRVYWKGLGIVVKTFLTFAETVRFTDNVMNACFNREKDMFLPEGLDYAFRINVLMSYTNLEIPSNIEDQYRMVFETEIYDLVCAAINPAQLDSLKRSVDFCASNTMRGLFGA